MLHRTIAALCIATCQVAHAAGEDQLLREGGVTIYFRHAATVATQVDVKGVDPKDCRGQRNLSPKGREQALRISSALQALQVDVEQEVLASPYCRTMETASLIAGRATPTRDVLGSTGTDGKRDYSKLEKILATPPPKGKIRIVVNHGNQLEDLAGPPELAEGEAAIIRGDGKKWAVVARIPAGEWAKIGAR
ncbi:MAG: histidine phosphatase family protein [Usitatibacter sp.]